MATTINRTRLAVEAGLIADEMARRGGTPEQAAARLGLTPTQRALALAGRRRNQQARPADDDPFRGLR